LPSICAVGDYSNRRVGDDCAAMLAVAEAGHELRHQRTTWEALE
jgi:hypothetical protein